MKTQPELKMLMREAKKIAEIEEHLKYLRKKKEKLRHQIWHLETEIETGNKIKTEREAKLAKLLNA